MDVLDIFRTQGQHLFWERMDDARVVGRPTGEEFKPDEAYAVVRLAEMFLGTSRVLWRKRSPLVHAFVTSGAGKEQHTVAGPGQLQDLGERNLDRVILLNFRVAGPTPYRGDELQLLTGLYSVPREDTAAALINTVGALAGLVSPEAAGAADIAKVVKAGVDSILGLGETQAQVDTGALWIRDGRLLQGNSLALADPYRDHDYLIVQIERLERLPDWPSVPGLRVYEKAFKDILSSGKTKEAMYADLAPRWPQFTEALVNSPYLTRHDADEIAKDVEVDLKKRIEAGATNNPFETRGWGTDTTQQLDPREVDFGAVPERSAQDDALAGTGFGTTG
jgi:hypothetical protein